MAVTLSTTLSVNKAAYEQLAYLALRPELVFDKFATVKSTNLGPSKGVSVTFTINNDLPEQTVALTENVDITPGSMSDYQIVVPLAMYGYAIQLTAVAEQTAFYELNPLAANEIGFNAGASIDTIAANAMTGGTQVSYSGSRTTRVSVTKADILAGNDIRKARAALKRQHVQKIDSAYAGLIYPDVVYDITGTTGGSGWLDPHVYGQNQSGIWDATIGNFNGVNFLEVDRTSLLFSDAANGVSSTVQAVSGNVATITMTAHGLAVGNTFTMAGGTATSGTGSTSQVGFNRQFVVATVVDANNVTIDITGITATTTAGTATLTVKSVDVYATLIFGQQAIAKAFSTGNGYGEMPQIVDVPVTDKLKLVTGVGWKQFVGYAILRQPAMYRLESGSFLGI